MNIFLKSILCFLVLNTNLMTRSCDTPESNSINVLPCELLETVLHEMHASDRTRLFMAGSKSLNIKLAHAQYSFLQRSLIAGHTPEFKSLSLQTILSAFNLVADFSHIISFIPDESIFNQWAGSNKIIEFLSVFRNHPVATSLRIEGHYSGLYGYLECSENESHLIDELAAANNPTGIFLKIEGLLYGWYGFMHSKDEAKAYVQTLIALDHPIIPALKIKEFFYGKFGFIDDPTVKSKIEMGVVKNDPEAIRIKAESLSHGWFGYIQDEDESYQFVTERANANNVTALELKISGICHGRYGFRYNKKAMNQLIEQLVSENHYFAKLLKLKGLYKDKYGYTRASNAVEFIESQVTQETPCAIRLKANGLTFGLHGYKKDIPAANQFIEELARRHIPVALGLRIEGVFYGKYGYSQNKDRANALLDTFFGLNRPIDMTLQTIHLNEFSCCSPR